MDGEVFSGAKTKKDPPVLKVDAKWNEHATFVNVKTGERETLWKKRPYPENSDFMYGMSQFMI